MVEELTKNVGSSSNSTSKWSRQRDILVGQRVDSDAEFGGVDFGDIIQVAAAVPLVS